MPDTVQGNPDKKGNPSRINLYLSVFVVNLVFFSCGCIFGWTSPTIPLLQSPNSWLPISDAEASWIVSLLAFGGIIGPLLSGILLDSIGRKETILVNVLLFAISWALLGFATSVYIIYFARFICGFGVGVSFAALPLYIAEIAEDSVRGVMNTVMPIFASSGILLVYCVGPYISYLQLIIISSSPCVLFLMFYPWLPESPYYLVYKNDTDKAVSNLQWLRGDVSHASIEREINDIQIAMSETNSRKSSIVDVFATASCRRALVLSCGLLFFQQMTGESVIFYYTEPIFKMTGTSISTSLSAIIFSIVNVIIGVLSPPIVNYFGYKKPLIASGLAMLFTHATLGGFLYLAARNYDVLSFNWIPVFSLVGYIVARGIGFANIPWAIMGELFPSNVKALAAAISTSFCSIVGFILTNLFPDLVISIGIDFVFGLFGISCIAALFFVIYLVPDTNGLSLIEIQELMNNPYPNRNKRRKTIEEILPQQFDLPRINE